MNKLPSRPNLDHLRRQAKSLLLDLASGDATAISTIREHLPAAKDMTQDQVHKAGFRLADAQSAIARKSGFDSWPLLSRHVEQLRSLEGTWEFVTLQIDGQETSNAMLATSRLLIDGDRFRTETPGATYEGIFNIDVQAEPHGIDIDFVEGPEAGNRNRGIFRLEGDRLTICLDMNGKARPSVFQTAPGMGHALQTLKRSSGTRPASVTGGAAKEPCGNPQVSQSAVGFEYVESPTLTRLQGEWSAVKVLKNGQELPSFMSATGWRTALKNEVKVSFGGKLMIHALVRIDEAKSPIQIDYYNMAEPLKGTVQHGIMQWIGSDPCFCMASPGQDRPADFACTAASGHTLSQWRPAKKKK